MNTILKPLSSYKDERGTILQLVDNTPFSSVLYITCAKGAIRANHWHKEDYHVCVLTKGKMNYYERPVGGKEKPTKVVISAGETFYTPPMVEHCMEFLEESEFFCYSKLSRAQEHYENDTVRLAEPLHEIV